MVGSVVWLCILLGPYWCVCGALFGMSSLIPNSAPHTQTQTHTNTHTHTQTHTHQYGPNKICSHITEPNTTMYFN